MALNESGEMYLETIYILSHTQSAVRSLDVAEYMGYSKPSVSRAVGLLRKAAYIMVDEHGYITLTEAGNEIAAKIYDRHITLSSMLIHLGVDEKTATEDACRMEHAISDKSFAAIKQHLAEHQGTVNQ